MKRMLCVFLCALGGLMLAGCGAGNGGGSPGAVVKKYVKALSDGDTKTALTCVEPGKRSEAGQFMEMGSSIASGFAKSEGGLDSVTILKEDVRGDQARVAYQTKTKKGMERQDAVNVERVDGTWYIAP